MVKNERYYILKLITTLASCEQRNLAENRSEKFQIFILFPPHITLILGHCCVEYSTCTPASPVASGENDPSFAFDYFTNTDKAKSGADCTEDYIEITGIYVVILYIIWIFLKSKIDKKWIFIDM